MWISPVEQKQNAWNITEKRKKVARKTVSLHCADTVKIIWQSDISWNCWWHRRTFLHFSFWRSSGRLFEVSLRQIPGSHFKYLKANTCFLFFLFFLLKKNNKKKTPFQFGIALRLADWFHRQMGDWLPERFKQFQSAAVYDLVKKKRKKKKNPSVSVLLLLISHDRAHGSATLSGCLLFRPRPNVVPWWWKPQIGCQSGKFHQHFSHNLAFLKGHI